MWRYVHVKRARVIIDAADYFAIMQAAMLNARYRILLIGWDFDTRIHLAEGRSWYERSYKDEHPKRLGSLFTWLTRTNKTLEIRILKWSFGLFKFAVRGSMWVDLARWARHRRIDFKFDSAHPVGGSHHQKIAVLDSSLAVCGGIDMTVKRWDTRDHDATNELRKTPRGSEYGPWHDATMMLEGDAAETLSELGRDRWIKAGGTPLLPIKRPKQSLWPEGLQPMFEDFEIGIARTRAKHDQWGAIKEIEALFVRHIRRAKKFIYAESQYFASRVIAEAITARLGEDDPPEIVIVHPEHADGWLEKQAMDHARAAIVYSIEEADKKHRFTLWTPFSDDVPIYVHAKIMIIDDEIVRIGSANMNNRSMGLDSECDVFIDAAREGNEHCADAIRDLRLDLLGEHVGMDKAEVAAAIERHGSMAEMIDHAQTKKGRNLRRYHPPELSEVQEKLAESGFLDPESPDEVGEAFAEGGLFRKGTRLARMRNRYRRLRGK